MIPCTTWSFNLFMKFIMLRVVGLPCLLICELLHYFTTTRHILSLFMYFHRNMIVFIWTGILVLHHVESILHFACLFESRLY